MIVFLTQLIIPILVAMVLLCLIGVYLWRNVFNETSDFQPLREDSPAASEENQTPKSDKDVEIRPVLTAKTVSSADTISNQSDDDVVELMERRLSSQQTVENAGDASVSIDDESE